MTVYSRTSVESGRGRNRTITETWVEQQLARYDAVGLAWSDENDRLWVWDEGQWKLIQPRPVNLDGILPPENLALQAGYPTFDTVAVDWTNPTQPFITPNEVWARIPTVHGTVWFIYTYPTTEWASSGLDPNTGYTVEVKLVRRYEDDTLVDSPVAALPFVTDATGIGPPAPDPGGDGDDVVVPIYPPPPDPPQPPGPIDDPDSCWVEWKLELDNGDGTFTPVDSGTAAGTITESSISLADLADGIYRFCTRWTCGDTSTSAWTCRSFTVGGGDIDGDPCGAFSDALFLGDWSGALVFVPKTCFPDTVKEAVSDTEMTRGPSFGGIVGGPSGPGSTSLEASGSGTVVQADLANVDGLDVGDVSVAVYVQIDQEASSQNSLVVLDDSGWVKVGLVSVQDETYGWATVDYGGRQYRFLTEDPVPVDTRVLILFSWDVSETAGLIWIEGVTADCTRTADDYVTLAQELGGALLWVDWCNNRPVVRDAAALTVTDASIATSDLEWVVPGPGVLTATLDKAGQAFLLPAQQVNGQMGSCTTPSITGPDLRIVLWVYVSDWGVNGTATILDLGGEAFVQMVRVASDDVRIQLSDDATGATYVVRSTNVWSKDAWHKVEFQFDADGNVDILIDDVADVTQSHSASFSGFTSTTKFGSYPGGSLGQVMVWDTLDASPETAYNAAVLADSPVVYYRFHDGTGTTVEDEAGVIDNDGAITTDAMWTSSCPLEPGSPDLGFNGSRYMSAPDDDALTMTSFTLEILFKPTDTSITSAQALMAKWSSSFTSQREWVVNYYGNGANAGRFTMTIGNTAGSTWKSLFTASELPDDDGNWHHIVARYDDSTGELAIWMDGTELASSTPSASGTRTGNTAVGITAGAYGGSPTFYLNGFLSHYAIYDTALSDARILAHAQAGGFI